MTDPDARSPVSAAGITHGVAWKIAALAAKAGFLFLVAPRMPAGEFAGFQYYSTVALVGGRFGSLGVSEQLVLQVGGARDVAQRFLPLFRRGVVVAGLLLAAAAWLRQAWGLALALAALLIVGAILEGLLRAVAPALYEQWLNIPPILFLGLILVGRDWSATALLLAYGLSTLAAQLLVAHLFGAWSRASRGAGARLAPGELLALARGGAGKMVAEMTLVADMRGLVIWSKVIAGHFVHDGLSLALAVAEALSTLPMVLVNRNYSLYARAGGARGGYVRRSAAAILLAMALAGSGAAVAGQVLDLSRWVRLDWGELGWAVAFFGAITAYYDLRYHAWASTRVVHRLTALQVLFFGLQGVVVAVLPEPRQMMGVALVANLAVSGHLVWSAWSDRRAGRAAR